MCNLYNVTTTTEAMRQFTRAIRDLSGFNEPSRDVYPGTLAPVVRVGANGQREIVPLTWGMPSPPSLCEELRSGGDEHSEYQLASLAALARACQPMHRAVHQLRRA